jgi:pimeloyl-ACP methyl ester carboxylesterase
LPTWCSHYVLLTGPATRRPAKPWPDSTFAIASARSPLLCTPSQVRGQPIPVGDLREIADGVRDGRLLVLDGVAHLAPTEAPAAVARVIREAAANGGRP